MNKAIQPFSSVLAGILGAGLVLLIAAPPAPTPSDAAVTAVEAPADDGRFEQLEETVARLQLENERLARDVAAARGTPGSAEPSEEPAAPAEPGPGYTQEQDEAAAARVVAQRDRRSSLFDRSASTQGWSAADASAIRALFLIEVEQGAALFAQARLDGDFGGASRSHQAMLRAHDRAVRSRLGNEGESQWLALREEAERRRD